MKTPDQIRKTERESMRRLREDRKAWGLCPQCGKKLDPDEIFIYCEACRARNVEAKRRCVRKQKGGDAHAGI